MANEIEYRHMSHQTVELRATGDEEKRTIGGYAVKYWKLFGNGWIH